MPADGSFRNCAVFSLLIFILIGPSSVEAGNEHEHLQYLPSYDDIHFSMKGNLGKKRTSELLSKDLGEITSRFGPGVLSEKEFLDLRRSKNFEDFSEALSRRIPGKSRDEIMRSFFELQDWHADAQASYGSAGSIRSQLFASTPGIAEPSVMAALNTAPKYQYRKCVFTIPKSLARKSLLSKLVHEFDSRRMQAQFYYSVSRKNLASRGTNFKKILEEVSTGTKEGWLHGIDISGSLWDRTFSYDVDASALMKERLIDLFKKSRESDIGIRLHAFENGRSGGFYDALWGALEDCKKARCSPPNLRIGHIYDLDDESLNRLLKSVKKESLIFEVNAESNYQLLEPRTRMLVDRIESLHKKGLRVAIGSDGIGILGERARFDASLSRFKGHGMSKRSLKKLIEEAYSPLPGSRFGESARRTWEIEQKRVTEALEKIVYDPPPAPSCQMGFLQRLRGLVSPRNP